MERGHCGGRSPRSRIQRALTRVDLAEARDPLHRSTYALADALLCVQSDDQAFQNRFAQNYGECAVSPFGRDPDVILRVRTLVDDVVLATFSGPEDPLHGFPADFLPARQAVASAGKSGWHVADFDHPVGSVAYGPQGLAATLDSPWEALFASVAVNRALSAQPQIMFFHGAAVRVNGRGVLLLGESGSGKTSVSLALAARGHDFYGDDIVGVRLDSRSIVPVRRAAHVRTGPAAPDVAQTVGDRRLVDVSQHFPQAGSAATVLDVLVCLRHFTAQTQVTPFVPTARDLRWVTPHVGSLYAGPLAHRTMRVVSLFSTSTCFFLDSASPASAASALEELTE